MHKKTRKTHDYPSDDVLTSLDILPTLNIFPHRPIPPLKA